jgi:hypothetical protein
MIINALMALVPGALSYLVLRYFGGAPEWASYSLAFVLYTIWYLHYQSNDKIKAAKHG